MEIKYGNYTSPEFEFKDGDLCLGVDLETYEPVDIIDGYNSESVAYKALELAKDHLEESLEDVASSLNRSYQLLGAVEYHDIKSRSPDFGADEFIERMERKINSVLKEVTRDCDERVISILNDETIVLEETRKKMLDAVRGNYSNLIKSLVLIEENMAKGAWSADMIQDVIDGKRSATDLIALTGVYNNDLCFSAGTLISMSDGSRREIQSISVGDIVSSFDSSDSHGRGPLHGKKVVRVYRNVTDSFIKLKIGGDVTQEPIFVTPQHQFLDETGSFMEIAALLKLGGGTARIIGEDGNICEATAEWVHFSAETANLFETASTKSVSLAGNAALEQKTAVGWRTYNFEVEDLHTYVANGIRVHNDSGVLGQLGNTIDTQFFDKFGRVGDAVGDIVTAPLHAAGEIVGGVKRAADAIADGVSNAVDRFSNGDILGGVAEVGKGIANAVVEVVKGIGEAVAEIGRGIGNAIEAIFGGNSDNDGQGNDNGKPIILDLDGDGVEIHVDGDVSFDMDADGFLEKTKWVGKDDAFLVIDLNADGSRGVGDGVIDQTKELVLSHWLGWTGATDLQALAMFDQSAEMGGNNNGKIDAGDSIWSELRVWQDANTNGVADAGELKSLNDMGFSEISLTYDDGTDYSDLSNDVAIMGSKLLGSASYIRNGQTVVGGVGDVALSFEASGYVRVETASGFEIQRENGEIERFYDVGKVGGDANYDLNSGNIQSGAYGDERSNRLTAAGVSGPVRLLGGAGNDTLIGSSSSDVLIGGTGDDVLEGFAGDDVLSGGQGFDHIIGGEGNDTLHASEGGDVLRGGLGDDTYLFERGTGAITIDETLFEVNGVYQYGDDNISRQYYNPPPTQPGKGIAGPAQIRYVHDLISGATAEPGNEGFDTILFGEGIGISDIVLTDDRTAEPKPWGLEDDFSTTIRFLGEDHEFTGDSIEIPYWELFGVDKFVFSSGYSIEWPINKFHSGVGDGANEAEIVYTEHSNWISALAGDDKIVGIKGHTEHINSGSGDDVIFGKSDNTTFPNLDQPIVSDYFIFGKDDGNDLIRDFVDDLDKIVLDVDGVGFDQLVMRDISETRQVVDYQVVDGNTEQHYLSESISGVEIDYGSGTIVLEGISLSQVTQEDFIFG